jgi:acetyl-CoA carboxylase carboxyltransferase component
MRPIVEALVDQGSFFEIGRRWGRSVIAGLARLDGWPVMVMASDPYHYGGAWTADACDKVIRMVDLAQTFQLPVVHLVDVPGFLIGRVAEEAGTIRHGARAMQAIYQCTVPGARVRRRSPEPADLLACLHACRPHQRGGRGDREDGQGAARNDLSTPG